LGFSPSEKWLNANETRIPSGKAARESFGLSLLTPKPLRHAPHIHIPLREGDLDAGGGEAFVDEGIDVMRQVEPLVG
jgi:hypothetical protein